jgi:two-component system KDP operon response regulator KdpE
VLVVDDEPQIRRALSLNLGARGYEVFEASSGEMAMAASATEHPDIVLLDLGLPGIDGATVLEALRGWTQVPVIVLTVRDDEPSKVQMLEAGADDYVTKPFGMAELVARIRAVLRRVPDPTTASTPRRPDHDR